MLIVKKRGFDISLLTDIIKKLAAGEPLPEKNRDQQLSGNYAGCRECHSGAADGLVNASSSKNEKERFSGG